MMTSIEQPSIVECIPTMTTPIFQFASPSLAWESVKKLPEATWWLPVCAATKAQVQHAKILDVDLVVWQTVGEQGAQWHAAIDQCPHRGAALSLGCLHQGQLQCPYHGWQFDAQGVCTVIPALPDFTPPAAHGLQMFEAVAYSGVVWVQLVQDVTKPRPDKLYDSHTAALVKAGMLHVLTQAYDVNTSAPRAVENFLDVSHFGTVHQGWLGGLDYMAVAPYTVETTAQSAKALGVRAWQPKSQTTLSQGAWVDYTYEVAHPYCAVLTKLPSAAGGLRESIAVWACPTSTQQCRVWFSLCMADVGQTAADVHAFQHTIFLQDKPVLESQRPATLPLDAKSEKHSGADRMSAAYRQLLQHWRIGFGTS